MEGGGEVGGRKEGGERANAVFNDRGCMDEG